MSRLKNAMGCLGLGVVMLLPGAAMLFLALYYHWGYAVAHALIALLMIGLFYRSDRAFERWRKGLKAQGLRVCPRCGGAGWQEGEGETPISCSRCKGAKTVTREEEG